VKPQVARARANNIFQRVEKMIGPVAVQPSLDLQLKNIPYLLSGDFHLIYRPPPLFLPTGAAIQGLPREPLPDSRAVYSCCTGYTECWRDYPPASPAPPAVLPLFRRQNSRAPERSPRPAAPGLT